MYTQYYRLTRKPFENTPDPLFFFQSKSHREVLASLVYGIDSAKGLIIVVGDIGTGKTTLIHALLKELDQSQIILKITNPRLVFAQSTIGNILEYFARELGTTTDKTDSQKMVEELTRELENRDKKGERAVLIIDEAHLLTEKSLLHIRLLSNIENEKRKLIQIVLMGQNELQHKIQNESLRSFKQRISISRKLMPLDKSETEKYVNHRLNIAGRESPLFEKKALSLIFKQSQGIPRLINQICDNALLIGYAVQAQLIGPGIVKEVIDDMNSIYAHKKPASTIVSPKLGWSILCTFFVIIVSLGLLYYAAFNPFGTPNSQNINKSIPYLIKPSEQMDPPLPDSKKNGLEKNQNNRQQEGALYQEADLSEQKTTKTGGFFPPNEFETPKDAPDQENRYVVQRGDTLYKIAGDKHVYADHMKWPSLFRTNLEALHGLDLRDDFEHRELPEGVSLNFFSKKEASQNLIKLGKKAWVVNVLSGHSSNEIVPVAVGLIRNGYHVYITRADVQGKEWLRLRVGFFRDSSEANSARDKISALMYLDDLWITRAEKELIEYGGY